MSTEKITPYRFDDPERHEIAMREVVETLVVPGSAEQQFSMLHLNRDFTEEPPIVRMNAMFTGCNSPEQKYAAYQFAAANPNRTIIDIDAPAHGYSDRLTRQQLGEVLGGRTLTLVAQSQLEAISHRVSSLSEMIVVGDSVGARLGIDLVSEAQTSGIYPEQFIGFEPIGLEGRLTPGVTFAYFVREYLNSAKIYNNHDMNLPHNVAYETDFKRELERFDFVNDFSIPAILKRDPSYILFMLARSPLAAGTGAQSLETILTTDDNLKASIVIGGLSTICRWAHIAPLAERLRSQYGDRAEFDLWPNDGHGMSLAPQQPRMARYVEEKIEINS